jgi:hypothetical protein
LYIAIDESQDRDYFVVGAIGAPTPHPLDVMIGRARAVVRREGLRIVEFNESDLTARASDLLDWWAAEIALVHHRKKRRLPREDVQVWVAYYRKTRRDRDTFTKARLQQVYVAALTRIFQHVAQGVGPGEQADVVYDTFPQAGAIAPEIRAAFAAHLRGNIRPGESSADKPLQAADIIAGTARRYLRDELAGVRRWQTIMPRVRLLERVEWL